MIFQTFTVEQGNVTSSYFFISAEVPQSSTLSFNIFKVCTSDILKIVNYFYNLCWWYSLTNFWYRPHYISSALQNHLDFIFNKLNKCLGGYMANKNKSPKIISCIICAYEKELYYIHYKV